MVKLLFLLTMAGTLHAQAGGISVSPGALTQASSIVACYDFVTFTGNNLRDITGHGHDAVPNITVTNQPYFQAPFSPLGTKFTIVIAISQWRGAVSTFLSFGHGSTFDLNVLASDTFSASNINAGSVAMATQSGASSSATSSFANPQTTQQIWTIVYDSTAGTKSKYYKDGVLLTSTNQGDISGGMPSTVTSLDIGFRHDGFNPMTTTDWQYLQIYDAAKSDAEVAAITSTISASLIGRQNLSQYTYYYPAFHNFASGLAVLASNDGATWAVIPSSYSGYSGLGGNFAAVKIGSIWWLAHEEPPDFTHSGLGTSTDGINWSYVMDLDFDGSFAGAPSWFIDSDSSVHLLFFIGTGAAAVVKEAHPTNAGFTTWSSTAALSGIATGSYDPFIVKIGSTYYCWYKNEVSKFIEYATASALTGPYTVIKSGDWAGWGKSEEISLVQISGAHWRAYFGPLNAAADVLFPMNYSDSFDSWATWSARVPLNPQLYYNGVVILRP